jgi:type I restriction enzyme S subunit
VTRTPLNKVYLAEEDGICSTDIWVLQGQASLLAEYLCYYLRTPLVCEKLSQSALGGQLPRVHRDIFNQVPIPVPTIPEQQHIIEFLNQAKILDAQWRETLEEDKQLSIDLFLEIFGDPDPRINLRWEVVKLGEVTQVETGGTPSRTNLEFYEGEIPWVKLTELVDKKIYHTEEAISDSALESSNTKKFPIKTVLLAMYGQGQTRGRTGLLEIEATCNQACAAILPNSELLSLYIFVWLQCSYERIRALGRGGQQENLNLSIVRALKVPKPPLEIQEEFCEKLLVLEEIQNESNSVDEQYKELLAEIVSEAFSGKLTQRWRETHQQELETWFREHPENLTRRTKRDPEEVVLPERAVSIRSTRRSIIGQLSATQSQVYSALTEWQGIFLPSEHLERFLEEWLVESLEDSYQEDIHDHVLRALNQLAGLGLIARISLPNRMGEYITGYRTLREEELTKASDLTRLRALS